MLIKMIVHFYESAVNTKILLLDFTAQLNELSLSQIIGEFTLDYPLTGNKRKASFPY